MVGFASVSRLVCAAGVGVSALLGASAAADVIQVPPVVISGLHSSQVFSPSDNVTYVSDVVFIPNGPGQHSGPGFSASISGGDVVVVRIEPPAGHRFRLHDTPGATGRTLSGSFTWSTGTGDIGQFPSTATFTFEGLEGPAPTPNFESYLVTNAGESIVAGFFYQYSAPCAFSAIRIEFPVTHGLADVQRCYGPVGSSTEPSFAATATFPGMNPVVDRAMSLEPYGLGACCTGATCTQTLPGDCAGVYLGVGSSCTPPVRGGTINACCPADFNGHGGLDVSDIFAFLSAWFAGCP